MSLVHAQNKDTHTERNKVVELFLRDGVVESSKRAGPGAGGLCLSPDSPTLYCLFSGSVFAVPSWVLQKTRIIIIPNSEGPCKARNKNCILSTQQLAENKNQADIN